MVTLACDAESERGPPRRAGATDDLDGGDGTARFVPLRFRTHRPAEVMEIERNCRRANVWKESSTAMNRIERLTIVVKPDEGRPVSLGGMGVVLKFSGADTGEAFAVVEHPIEPGWLWPLYKNRAPLRARAPGLKLYDRRRHSSATLEGASTLPISP
jgi:hypothetical protein